MKKHIIFIAAICFAVTLASCNDKNNSSSKVSETTSFSATETSATSQDITTNTTTNTSTLQNTATNSQTETTSEKKIDENEDDKATVSITIPSDIVSEVDDFTDIENDEDIISETINDDGSITIVMTKKSHNELTKELSIEFDKQINEIAENDDYPSIIKIKHNADYSEFVVTVDNEDSFKSGDDSFATLSLYFYSYYYGIFNGKDVDDVNIKYIDRSTGLEFFEEE